MRLASLILLTGSLAALHAQLTPEQRQFDFLQLAGMYAKQYGLYEWKRDALGFDLYNVRPWLDRVARAQNDIEFLDICAEYTQNLKDSHVFFAFPSRFRAQIGLFVDIYDGRVLIEGIDRRTLPAAEYPFAVGDEIVSVDGVAVDDWITSNLRWAGWPANPRSARRSVVDWLFFRPQQQLPRAFEVGDTASVVVRRASGDLETYTIPWQKTGEIVRNFPPVPSPRALLSKKQVAAAAEWDNPIQLPVGTPEYLRPLYELGHAAKLDGEDLGVTGVGSTFPVWSPPAGFQPRLVSAAGDFLTGTYRSGDLRIGVIRIPRMSPFAGLNSALQTLENEVAFMEQNTDGLVVDVMRNPGGLIVYGHELARRFIPYPFESVTFELRITATRISQISAALESAKALNADRWVIDLYTSVLEEMRRGARENRARTGPLPLAQPNITNLPANVVYTKPLIVLVDEFSGSTADLFPAVMQDAGRGLLVGMRTGGLGGTNGSYNATTYSEAIAGVTFGLMVRPKAITTPDFGTTHYIENVGVRPDIELDYMTRANLMQAGRPFVEAFTNIIVERIRANR